MKLNLGSGNLKKEGFLNIDISKECNPDRVLDITKGLPFEDNSCEEIHCGCVLEQICCNEKFIFVLNEIWRVLKPDGKLTGYVPSTDASVLFKDPMDCRFFQLDTFKYFTVDEHYYKEFGKNYGFKPWKNINTKVQDGIIFFEMQPAK